MKMKVVTSIWLSFLVMLFFTGMMHAEPMTKDKEKKTESVGFRVKWDGKVIPGIISVSGLDRKTEIIQTRNGGESESYRKTPGLTSYAPLVLVREKSGNTEFEEWANKVFNLQSGQTTLKSFRKDLIIEILDNQGRLIMAYRVYRCWPSEYIALSGLDKKDDSIATETLVLENEGWERDPEVVYLVK